MSMPDDNEANYVPVRLTDIGFIDQSGLEGAVTLVSLANENKRMTMRSFSGEVATHIARFMQGDRSSIPSVYNLVEDIAERSGMQLVNVRIYSSHNNVLRGDVTFKGREKTNLVLHGYRASDCVALATFYDAPILLHSSLLENVV